MPSIETNYKHLINSQISQTLRYNDWWGYFGSFVLGSENLVLNNKFVGQFKVLLYEKPSNLDILSFIHNQHFNNNYKFIYLNIIPSLSGLYFLTPTLVQDNYLSIFQYLFLLLIIIYLLRIVYFNLNYFLNNSFVKKKFIYFIILTFLLLVYFFYIKNFWVIIKFFTYSFHLFSYFLQLIFIRKKLIRFT